MKNLGIAVAAGAGLLVIGGGAWAASRKQVEQGAQGGTAAQNQPGILELLDMENVSDELDYSLPRGIRLNNPLNIRENQRTDYDWNGEHAKDLDGDFEEFIDPRYGYRAAARIMQSYARRGITTLQQIIATWAPATENNVQAYVRSVSARSGIASFQIVTKDMYPRLFEAMTWHENGQQPYELALIAEGVAWA